MDKSKALIVIPCYNEKETIAKAVKEAISYANTLVVDDCSSDESSLLAEGAGAICLRLDTNKGYGQAISLGLIWAKENGYEYVLTIDADNQHPTVKIPEFLNRLNEGVTLTCGVRDRMNRLSEVLVGLICWSSLGVRDPLCGMKGYNLSIFSLDELKTLLRVDAIGMNLLIHTLIESRWRGDSRYIVDNLPITIKDRKEPSRFGDSLWVQLDIVLSYVRAIYYYYFRKYQR